MKLALFFTYGMSLEKWAKIGSLSREIKPYQILAKKFDQIYFFTYGSKKDLAFLNVVGEKITILPNFLKPFLYWKILKNVDVFKTNQMAGALPAVMAKLYWRKKKLIVRCGYEWLNVLIKEKKSFWKKAIVYILEKIAYKVADIVIFTSEKDKDFALKKFKIPEGKIRLIPNYINTELFKPLDIIKEKNTVLYIGRLSKEKNLFNLIEAMVGVNAKLKIIGQGSQQKDLVQFVKEKAVNVEFLGAIPNEQLPQELNKSEIFILSSLYEGCPKALLEAMACGLSCIATDVEGIKEVITHQENGYLCQTTSQAIHQALENVLNNNDLKEKVGQNARETILNNFALEKIIEKELTLYEKILG